MCNIQKRDIQLNLEIFVISYETLSFAKDASKNISKNVNGK